MYLCTLLKKGVNEPRVRRTRPRQWLLHKKDQDTTP